jgi:hypothetical protein
VLKIIYIFVTLLHNNIFEKKIFLLFYHYNLSFIIFFNNRINQLSYTYMSHIKQNAHKDDFTTTYIHIYKYFFLK